MPIIDVDALAIIERLPGWHGRYFHTAHLTVAHYEFAQGAFIHAHSHPEEEVYEVIEGELAITIDDATHVLRPGVAAVIPPNVRHAVRALTNGRVLIVDHPARPEFGGPKIETG